jgi:hypothetical protein
VRFPHGEDVADSLKDKKEKGFYAVRVTGTPPSDVIEGIAAHGGVWRPRDTIDEL